MFIYFEGLLPPSTLESAGSAAPTSKVYVSSTIIQLIAEYKKLWCFATLQWHNVPTKIVNLGEVIPALTLMDKRPIQ
jgi:hypothetical protein